MTPGRALREAHIWRVAFPARQAALDRLLECFEALARARRLPDALRRELHLVIDEVVSNIVHAARRSAATRVTLELAIDRDAITMEVADNGKAFDPTRAKPPRRGGSPLDRPAGGLGILLVRSLMDRVAYTRRNGENRLMLVRAMARKSPRARGGLRTRS